MQFKEITQKNCKYCGIVPNQIIKQKIANKKTEEYTYNGVDRVDSAVGYTLTNCVPCCKMCNGAKRDYCEEDFLRWVRRLYEHSLT